MATLSFIQTADHDRMMTQLANGSTARKHKSAKQNEARRRAIRERLSQKHGADRPSSDKIGSAHADRIAKYHALEKRIGQTGDDAARTALLLEQEKLGGLPGYQSASLEGAKYGETSKWLVQELERLRGRQQTSVLDVGAITGTAYAKYKSFNATYIDLNPQAEHVQKMDILDFPVQDKPFDVVCLSLVINFIGDFGKRSAPKFAGQIDLWS